MFNISLFNVCRAHYFSSQTNTSNRCVLVAYSQAIGILSVDAVHYSHASVLPNKPRVLVRGHVTVEKANVFVAAGLLCVIHTFPLHVLLLMKESGQDPCILLAVCPSEWFVFCMLLQSIHEFKWLSLQTEFQNQSFCICTAKKTCILPTSMNT